MAAIPTYVHIGGSQLNGGSGIGDRPNTEGAAFAGLGGLWGIYRNWPKFNKCVPADPTTGLAPGAPAYAPYWDGYIAVTNNTIASGTSTSAGATTLSVAPSPGWTPSAFIGANVTTTSGVGSGQTKAITGNTADTITVGTSWSVNPTASGFVVTSSTSATATTLTVSPSPGWANNAYAGCTVTITSGTGSGQSRYVLSNTADTLTVTAAWGTNPTASGFAIKGGWVVYHHTNSTSTFVVPGAKGDRWYEFGGGITPTTMLMQLLGERHASAPYFKMFKVAVDGGIGVGSAPLNGSGWTAVVDQYDAAVRAMGSDTPDVQAVIIDASDADINAANLSYETHLQAVITAAREKFGSTCLILLVSHHVDMNPSGLYPTASAFARNVNRTIASANADVVVFDMNWAKFAPNSVGTYAAEDASPQFYDSESYIQAGARMFNAIEAWRTDAPAAQPGSGIAVVAMVTDSQGTTLQSQQAIYSYQASILGAVGGTVRAGQYIWNGSTRQVELYDANANAGTEPVVYSSQCGFELTMMKRLAESYPDGVVIFKFTKNGAAVTEHAVDNAGASGAYESSANDLLPDLTSAWNDFRSAVFRDLNRTPDCIGMVLAVGDNDTFADATAELFAAAMPVLVDDLRDVFTTRSSGNLPAVLLQPPKHLTLTGGQSSHGIATARESIRATISSLPSVRSSLTILESDADRYELSRVDNIHYGAEATYAIGYDFADALISLIDGEGATAAATGDTPSGTATFVVEDGSGLTTSNSYCSTAAADTYHAAQGNPSDWADADLLTKQDALRRATESLDLAFGARWNGFRSTSEQALDWPRAWCIDSAGNDIASDSIPTRLAVATARGALLIVQGYTIVPTTQTTADIASESNSVGEVSRSVTYRGGKPATTQFPLIERMLVTAGLASSGAGWGVASA